MNIVAEHKSYRKPPVVRSYRLAHHTNRSKLERIAAVLPQYQNAARIIQTNQMREFVQHGGQFWNRREPGQFETRLSERYKRSVQNQVVGGLDSWLALSKDVIRLMIGRSSLSDETKADLWWLNKSNAHYRTPAQATVPIWDYDKDGNRIATEERRPASAATLALLRAMMKHVRKHRVRVPRLWHSRTMTLDGTVAQVETARGETYDYWVRISTLEKGEPAWAPLSSNQFFNKAPGEISNFAQVTISRSGEVKISLVKRSYKAEMVQVGIDLHLDWGLRSMFATDLGDQVGLALYPWLRKVDPLFTKLTSELQRQGVKLDSSKRYRRFQQRIRDYVRNEVGRVVNRLIAVYGPRSITVEDLDFRNGGLSKQMNRILSRAGRAAVKEKMAAISETLGISIYEVNPAYTSQECSGCGFVDPKNRSGLHFVCGFCGKRLNADTNGSRVISRRRSSGCAWSDLSRGAVLRRLDSEFATRWGLHPGVAQELRDRPKERRVQAQRPTTDGLSRQLTSQDHQPASRKRGKRSHMGINRVTG